MPENFSDINGSGLVNLAPASQAKKRPGLEVSDVSVHESCVHLYAQTSDSQPVEVKVEEFEIDFRDGSVANTPIFPVAMNEKGAPRKVLTPAPTRANLDVRSSSETGCGNGR